jgi:hypothetical protein
MQIYSPNTIDEYLSLVNKLNKRYRGKDWSHRHSIVLTSKLFSEMVSTLVDLQNRIEELEADND